MCGPRNRRESKVPETDTISRRSSRFRTNRYPGFVGGSTSPTTGNLVPAPITGNPQSASGAASSSIAPAEPKSALANIQVPEFPEPPGVGDYAKQVAGAGAQYAGGVIGEAAGKAYAAGPTAGDLGASVSQGFSDFGTDVKDFGTKVADFGSNLFGGGETAIAAGTAPTEVVAGASKGTPFEGSIGGGIGVGLARAGVGLLTGEKPGKALKSGAATGIGYALGSAITGGNPIGGFVGSVVGSLVGGRVICTELYRQKKIGFWLYFNDLRHAHGHMDQAVIEGYHRWAVPVVRWMRRDDWIGRLTTAIAKPLATWRAMETAYVMGFADRRCWEGWLVRKVGEPLCWLIGQFDSNADWRSLYNTKPAGG